MLLDSTEHLTKITLVWLDVLQSTDIQSLWQYQDPEHPLSIIPGQGVLWLSYQPANMPTGKRNGTVYFDNLRVVYGTNLDDLDNPVIDEMTVNGQTLTSDGATVINANSIEAIAKYHDVDGQNRSGINAQATTVKIDGEPITSADCSDANATVRLNLQNGKHTMTVSVSDAFGNTVEKTMAFVVAGDMQDTATVSVSGSNFVPLGGDYTLTVTADGKVTTGTMPNNGAVSKTLDAGTPSYTIPKGYHSGAGKVSVAVETKTVTPTKAVQDIVPSTGKVLTKVSVAAIPDAFADTSGADALAANILDGKTAFVNGVKVTGSMPDNGSATATMDGLTTTSVTIPAGYTAGGTVSLTADIEEALVSI